MHKNSSLMLLLVIVWCLPCVVRAGDGFTQQDREMLIQLNIKVHELEKRVDQRLDQVDKRFLELRADMDKRFEQVDKRFEQVDNKLGDMFQLIVGILATFGGIVAVTISFALWDRRTMIRPFEDKVKKVEEKIAGNKKQIKSLIEAMRELASSNPKVAEVLRSFSLF
ncbi:MAG: hypothetical protein J7M20_05875 [Deltaproteobacteria bacterium]|nr:hypothetical protein [Deltaproteobacteria bacterium]